MPQGELHPGHLPAELPPEASAPHPALAAAIRACRQAMAQAWLLRVREIVPATRSMNDEEAVNNLLPVLDAMAETLEDPAEGTRHLNLIGGTHGVTRFQQGLSVHDLGLEYPVLRQVLVRQTRAQLRRELSAPEADALHGMVDRVGHLSMASYATLQEKDIRLEAEAMSRHLAMLSHDVRNTLNAALLSMQLIREHGAEVQAQAPALAPLLEELEEARRMTAGAVETMSRLLNAERLRSAQVRLEPKPIGLHGLLKSIRTASARAAGLRFGEEEPGRAASAHTQGRIEIDCPEDAVVRTDRDLLSTILQNLVGNAIRYAGHAPIRLVARPVDGADGGDAADRAWRVQVIDAGPGIAPGQLETIFRPFRRGAVSAAMAPAAEDHAQREAAGHHGAGLGLFICRRAADLLGAELAVDSELGRGTTFTLTLPAKPAG